MSSSSDDRPSLSLVSVWYAVFGEPLGVSSAGVSTGGVTDASGRVLVETFSPDDGIQSRASV